MSAAELWIVASTILFVALVWTPAKRAVLGGLDSRRATIVRDLEEARRLRQEAEALLADARSRHASAEGEAERIVAFAREEALRLRTHAENEMKLHLARRERQATDRIAQAEAAALGEIRARAVDLAMAASGRLLSDRLSGEAGDRLVDEIIATLPGKLSATG